MEGSTPLLCFATEDFINPWQTQDLWCRNKAHNSHLKDPQKGCKKGPNALGPCQSKKSIWEKKCRWSSRVDCTLCYLRRQNHHWFLIWFLFLTWSSSQFWVWGPQRWSHRSRGCLVLHREASTLVHLLPSRCSQSLTSRRRRNTKHGFLSKPSLFPTAKLSIKGRHDVPWVLQRTIRSMEIINLYPNLAGVTINGAFCQGIRGWGSSCIFMINPDLEV